MSTCSYGSSCAGRAMLVESFFDTTATVLTVIGPPAAAAAVPPLLSGEPELQPAMTNARPAGASSRVLIAPPPFSLRTSGFGDLPDRASAIVLTRCAAPVRKPWAEEGGWQAWPPPVRQSPLVPAAPFLL